MNLRVNRRKYSKLVRSTNYRIHCNQCKVWPHFRRERVSGKDYSAMIDIIRLRHCGICIKEIDDLKWKLGNRKRTNISNT